MGQSISRDIITLVSQRVHRYETRCALRLTCKKFAQYICIFDEQAFPIFAKRGFRETCHGDEVIWKGYYTHVVSRDINSGYQTVKFRPRVRHYLCFFNIILSKYVYEFQSKAAHFTVWSTSLIRSKYSDQRCILWKFLENLSKYTQSAVFSYAKDIPVDLNIHDYVSTRVFDEHGASSINGNVGEIWTFMEDYQAALKEMEHVATMADADGIYFSETREDALLRDYYQLKRLKMD